MAGNDKNINRSYAGETKILLLNVLTRSDNLVVLVPNDILPIIILPNNNEIKYYLQYIVR